MKITKIKNTERNKQQKKNKKNNKGKKEEEKTEEEEQEPIGVESSGSASNKALLALGRVPGRFWGDLLPVKARRSGAACVGEAWCTNHAANVESSQHGGLVGLRKAIAENCHIPPTAQTQNAIFGTSLTRLFRRCRCFLPCRTN